MWMELERDQQEELNNRTSSLPLAMGMAFHIVMGPRLANWPNDNSKKNMGIPTKINISTYGMRNAPATRNTPLK